MRLSPSLLSIDAAIDNVIDFERQIKSTPLIGSVTVELPSRKELSIKIAGREFLGHLDSKLIHQLGSKVWPNLDRSTTVMRWQNLSQVDLIEKLQKALSNSGYDLRYNELEGVSKVYGITSPSFVEMNQATFRNVLIKSLRPLGIQPRRRALHTPYGEVAEEFAIPGSRHQVGLTCNVVYGLNNGYSSFRVNWGRVVLVCKNGLTAFKCTERHRWIHNNVIKIEDFARKSVEAAYSHLSDVEKQISAAQHRSLNYSLLDQFMTRLTLANATKRRVSSRLSYEFNDTGLNEWSLSQALTFLGQHEKAIPLRVRDDLTRLGSSVLEEPLLQILSSPGVVTPSGFYGILR
tara:strand:+ start:4410 stop:5450 length:1041 start_codon:yes stop_codon:yes gene_type:complete